MKVQREMITRKFNKHSVKSSVLSFKSSFFIGTLLVAFSLSPLSVLFTSKYIGNNFIEPFLILGIILLSKTLSIKKILEGTIQHRYFILSMFILLLLFIIGLLNTSEIGYVYADFRCNVLLLFSFLLFSNSKIYEWKNGLYVKLLLWAMIIMDLIYSIIMLKSNLEGVGDARIRMVSPINCLVLMYLYMSRWKNLNLAFILLAIITWHTVVSSMRNFYVIFALSLILFVINMLFVFKTKLIYKFIIILSIITLPIYAWTSIMNFWMSDESRSIHSVNRVEETISGESSETERINAIILPISDATYYIVPHGLGWRGFVDTIQRKYGSKNILSTMDSAYFYLCFHYGLIITSILILLSIKSLLINVWLLKKVARINFIILTCLFIVAFFTQATMFAYLTFSFCYGVLLSQIYELTRNKYKYNILLKNIHGKASLIKHD